MNTNSKVCSLIMSLMIVAGLIIGNAYAQAPEIKVSLALSGSHVPNKLVYLLDNPATQGKDPEPIVMEITLKNTGVSEITSMGFKNRLFHLYLVFAGPGGAIINANELGRDVQKDPPPPENIIGADGEFIQVEAVESVENGWTLTVSIPNAHAYYTLMKAGNYSVIAMIPMRTYTESIPGTGSAALEAVKWEGALESNRVYFSLVDDADGDMYSFPEAISPPYGALVDCDDNNPAVFPGSVEIPGNGIDDDCNAATSDVVKNGTLAVQVDKHIIGTGSNPGSTKVPLNGVPVRVYDKSAGSCLTQYGVSWQNYLSVWLNCFPVNGGIGTTSNGMVNFTVAPGNYVIIGEYNPDSVPGNGDEIYMGVSAGDLGSGETKKKYLQILEKADAKKVPGKYTVKTGSELLIIEPEYIEWDGNQELYPFVFESVGDWGVVTSVNPPEGFVTDHDNLSTDVNSEHKALQFVIKDVGSKWVDTKVQHTILHKGKKEIVTSTVGIKCAKKLQKKKKFDEFCNKVK